MDYKESKPVKLNVADYKDFETFMKHFKKQIRAIENDESEDFWIEIETKFKIIENLVSNYLEITEGEFWTKIAKGMNEFIFGN